MQWWCKYLQSYYLSQNNGIYRHTYLRNVHHWGKVFLSNNIKFHALFFIYLFTEMKEKELRKAFLVRNI